MTNFSCAWCKTVVDVEIAQVNFREIWCDDIRDMLRQPLCIECAKSLDKMRKEMLSK